MKYPIKEIASILRIPQDTLSDKSAEISHLLTDSRSFLSYPRHEYFRRLLCNILGTDVEKGLLPNDHEILSRMVEDISYNNARNYFKFY